jgi:hypothetical protein
MCRHTVNAHWSLSASGSQLVPATRHPDVPRCMLPSSALRPPARYWQAHRAGGPQATLLRSNTPGRLCAAHWPWNSQSGNWSRASCSECLVSSCQKLMTSVVLFSSSTLSLPRAPRPGRRAARPASALRHKGRPRACTHGGQGAPHRCYCGSAVHPLDRLSADSILTPCTLDGAPTQWRMQPCRSRRERAGATQASAGAHRSDTQGFASKAALSSSQASLVGQK